MLIRSIIAGVGLTTCVATGVVLTEQASAASPDRFTEVELVQETWGTCGPGDELVADLTVTEAVTIFSSGRGTLHLRVVGTITRTGTGAVAKYSEKQRDFEFVDGSAKVVGLLAHLVVSGGPGFTVAGNARIGPDGTLISITPGLATIFELDQYFVPIVCGALSG